MILAKLLREPAWRCATENHYPLSLPPLALPPFQRHWPLAVLQTYQVDSWPKICTSAFSKWSICPPHNQVTTSLTLFNVTCYLVREARKRSYFVCIGFAPNSNVVLTIFGFIRGCTDRRHKKLEVNEIALSRKLSPKFWLSLLWWWENASLVFFELINPWQLSFSLQLLWGVEGKGQGGDLIPDINFHAQLTFLVLITGQ